MKKNYTLEVFQKKCAIAKHYFDEIDQKWPPKEGEPPFSYSIQQKIYHDKNVKVFPYLFYLNQQPIGILWIELSSDFYGNISFYIPEKIHVPQLISLLEDKTYFDNKIMEIVGIDEIASYKNACFRQELVPNIRKRMYLWLSEYTPVVDDHTPFTFCEYTSDWYDWSSKLSVESHKVSRDYVHYQEMKTPVDRKRLEERVLKGVYGPIVQPASLVVFFNNQPVGYCLVVDVECWGYKAVPWIFDICIDPAFHGQGVGKALSYEMINQLHHLNYEIMGLAVTLTNTYAIALYEKLGFVDLDIFYEFIRPV